MSTSKKGVPALYLQKQLKIGSYRAAWLMGQKIRQAMKQRNDLYQTAGTVEVDEIHIGGQQTHDQRRLGSNKSPFLIMVEETRKGGPRFLSFEELETIYAEHVLPALERNVQKGSILKSDGAGAYLKARKEGYKQRRSIYQKNRVKTQKHLWWVNMITSNLKRFLVSTHHGVHPRYRKTYLEEFAYRFNRRHWPKELFNRLLYACVAADPTTLRELTA